MPSQASPEALARIGFNRSIQLALNDLGDVAGTLARVAEPRRGRCLLHDGAGEFLADPHPKFARSGPQPIAGDWVLVEQTPGGRWMQALVPRVNCIVRGTAHGEQPLVANVDTALLVMGLDGNFNLNRIERLLALARGAQVAPVVVLTKRDLCADLDARLAETQAVAGTLTPVLACDARDTADCAAQLAPWLGSGQTLVLLGSSGVGKSTLTNALLGAQAQLTGAVSEAQDRGRHTTVTRKLLPLPGGACLIDTPGLREIGLTGDALLEGGAFDDIARLAEQCRFRDCRHEAEPGCAVRDGVPPERLESWHKLEREVALARQTPLQAQAERGLAKQIQRSLRKLYRDRDGKS